ncbi:hypothetical protein [Actinophytocola sp.]|uniref:hypothetical protein n=1 Tax=Actinophytocola sp. TaxID=1872138 RepID=UPI002ED0429C
MYEDAILKLIAAADRVSQWRADLKSFVDIIEGNGWGVEVTGPLHDLDTLLATIEATYRDLAAAMQTAGDAGAAAHEQAPWVPDGVLAPDSVPAGAGDGPRVYWDEPPAPPRAPRPDLTPTGDLVVNDPMWCYPSGTLARGGFAHLRVWPVEKGHVAIVTDLRMGGSVTNSAEDIRAVLVEQYGEPLTLLEHYRPADNFDDDGHTLDEITVVDGQPSWRKVWPVRPDDPDHEATAAWMREHGFPMLANPA